MKITYCGKFFIQLQKILKYFWVFLYLRWKYLFIFDIFFSQAFMNEICININTFSKEFHSYDLWKMRILNASERCRMDDLLQAKSNTWKKVAFIAVWYFILFHFHLVVFQELFDAIHSYIKFRTVRIRLQMTEYKWE